MRMRQSLHQYEAAFREAAADSVVRRERLRREAAQRSRVRRVEKTHKHGTLRFIGLIATIVVTTTLVTVVTFRLRASVARWALGCGGVWLVDPTSPSRSRCTLVLLFHGGTARA